MKHYSNVQKAALLLSGIFLAGCGGFGGGEVAEINNDWTGNEIKIESFFKKLSVRRVYDKDADTLIYLVYSRKIVDGSAKMSLATVPLYGAEVTWRDR